MKKASYLLIIVGVFFLAFGGYQWFSSMNAQNKATAEAQALIEERDPPSKQGMDPVDSATDFRPSEGETAGMLHIPRLDADLPIVEGTDEDDLAKGVGHYRGTAYPLQNDQIVLSGHRDTTFRRMGELELGDILTLQVEYGDFDYEITETKIVDADDRTIIVPYDEEVLTLTTCYPFTFVGHAPERYIIYAYPVDKNQSD